jgi:hypothetical protein
MWKRDRVTTPEKKAKKRRRRKILLGILLLLVIVRLALPWIVLKYVNHVLADIEQYEGKVGDIDIALFRGAYVIRDIRLDKKAEMGQKMDTIPFFTAKEIDLSVEWRSIFKGSFVGEIEVAKPVVNFVKEKHRGEDVKADTADFQDVIKDLMPLTVNRFQITDGQIHYLDPTRQPRIDVAMKHIEAVATNLSNVNDSSKLLPATLEATGEAYEGKFKLDLDFDALQKQPTFDLNLSVSHVNLPLLNAFFQAYGRFDVEKGDFGLYAEFAGKNGAFTGYVKPILKDIQIVQLNREEGSGVQILWESVIGGVTKVFQNQRKQQVATKIPIQGKFENPRTGLWNALAYVFQNAFVHALQPSIDDSIGIGDVEAGSSRPNFLQKVFSKSDKPHKKKG